MRVLIVEDQRMFREGVRRRLEQEADMVVVGEASSAQEALGMIDQATPDVALVDIRLPDISGIELARRLRQDWPALKILVLTGYDFDQYVRAMARIGVDGYLLKDAPQDSLVQALRDIAAGGTVLPPQIASKVIRDYSGATRGLGPRRFEELTIREMEVLELMHHGLRNNEIAAYLSISSRTVEAHVGSIVGKLGVRNRAEAIRAATEKGLLG